MSEHEDVSLDTGYSTPVPELDDHRHQSASVQRSRSRRGTVDTMHSAYGNLSPDLNLVNQGLLPTIARDFEQAIEDEDGEATSPHIGRIAAGDRSRRGTAATLDPRSVSPPNSVKAFADARRRERGLSTSEPNSVKAFAEARRHEDCELHRMPSAASRRSKRSIRSRRYTNDNDAKSFAGSNKTAEEDVCFPLHPAGNKDTLQIDFDLLEDFIADEESRDRTPPKGQPQARIFPDLRPRRDSHNPTILTYGGEVVDVPSNQGSDIQEKISQPESMDEFIGASQRIDNRFEFFSSMGESTIHAGEFGDLVLPGEDVRSLFTLPQGEDMDGVWWLNMNNSTDEEIRAICKAFGVHPLTIEDICTQEAREKIELFPSYYFACFRSFHVQEVDEGQQYEPFNIYVVVFREGTLSFSFSPNPHAANVRRRITMLKDYVALSADWICYALMLVISQISFDSRTDISF
jgi:magnesium transporter